jgi:hypothetical protein
LVKWLEKAVHLPLCLISNGQGCSSKKVFVLPLFIDVIGTDGKKYSVNANHILYISTYEKKGAILTEIILDRKESIDSEET